LIKENSKTLPPSENAKCQNPNAKRLVIGDW